MLYFRSIFEDKSQGQIESEPLVDSFRTKFDGSRVPRLAMQDVLVRSTGKVHLEIFKELFRYIVFFLLKFLLSISKR